MKTLPIALLACLMLITVSFAQDKPKTDDHKSEAKADTYDLSIKFVKGQKSRYRMTQSQTSTSSIGGQTTKTVSTTTYTISHETTDIDKDGKATIVENYERIQIKKKQDDEVTTDYDSSKDKPADLDPSVQVVALLHGLDFTVVVTPKGKVESVKGTDALKKKVEKQMGATYAQVLESMGFSKLVSDAAEASYLTLHAEPVKLGETWKASNAMDLPMVGKVTYTREYKLESIEDKNGHHCAHVTLKGDIKADKKKNAAIKYSYKDVDWTADIWLDLKTRETVYSSNTMKFKVEVEMDDYKTSTPSSATTVFELLPEKPADVKDPHATGPDEKKPARDEPGKETDK